MYNNSLCLRASVVHDLAVHAVSPIHRYSHTPMHHIGLIGFIGSNLVHHFKDEMGNSRQPIKQIKLIQPI